MTVRQMQDLLHYLGYELTPDGIDGPQTQGAVRLFKGEYPGEGQWEGLLKEAVYKGWTRPSARTDWWKEIRYFKRNEKYIGCSCGKCGGFPVEPSEKLMRLADKVREHFGSPMTPTSTVRCQDHNAASGGVKNSRHLTGKAMDYKIKGRTAVQILDHLRTLPEVRYAYAVNEKVVHMDIQ